MEGHRVDGRLILAFDSFDEVVTKSANNLNVFPSTRERLPLEKLTTRWSIAYFQELRALKLGRQGLRP